MAGDIIPNLHQSCLFLYFSAFFHTVSPRTRPVPYLSYAGKRGRAIIAHGVALTAVAARLGELHGQVHRDLLALAAPVDEDVGYSEVP